MGGSVMERFVGRFKQLAWFLPGFLLWAAFPPMGERMDVLAGKEHRFAKPPERRAVGRECKADARCPLTYALSRRVFGAVEDCKLPAESGGRGIERVARFPRDGLAAQGTVEARVGTRRDYRAAFADKSQPRP